MSHIAVYCRIFCPYKKILLMYWRNAWPPTAMRTTTESINQRIMLLLYTWWELFHVGYDAIQKLHLKMKQLFFFAYPSILSFEDFVISFSKSLRILRMYNEETIYPSFLRDLLYWNTFSNYTTHATHPLVNLMFWNKRWHLHNGRCKIY